MNTLNLPPVIVRVSTSDGQLWRRRQHYAVQIWRTTIDSDRKKTVNLYLPFEGDHIQEVKFDGVELWADEVELLSDGRILRVQLPNFRDPKTLTIVASRANV